jgi:hypothetical protein
VLRYAECPVLGKQALYRVQGFAECGSRQSLLCRVPDKKHSAKTPALGKGPYSGSAIFLGYTLGASILASQCFISARVDTIKMLLLLLQLSITVKRVDAASTRTYGYFCCALLPLPCMFSGNYL